MLGVPQPFFLGGNGPQGWREVTRESMEKYTPEDERLGPCSDHTFPRKEWQVIFEPKTLQGNYHIFHVEIFNQPSEAFRCDGKNCSFQTRFLETSPLS